MPNDEDPEVFAVHLLMRCITPQVVSKYILPFLERRWEVLQQKWGQETGFDFWTFIPPLNKDMPLPDMYLEDIPGAVAPVV